VSYSGKYDIIQIKTEDGTLIDEWEDDRTHDCTREYCGGCNRCMEMQAIHAGFKVEVLKVGGIIDRLLP